MRQLAPSEPGSHSAVAPLAGLGTGWGTTFLVWFKAPRRALALVALSVSNTAQPLALRRGDDNR
jgi:hypothetical protein